MSAGGSARKSTGRPSYYYRLLRRPGCSDRGAAPAAGPGPPGSRPKKGRAPGAACPAASQRRVPAWSPQLLRRSGSWASVTRPRCRRDRLHQQSSNERLAEKRMDLLRKEQQSTFLSTALLRPVLEPPCVGSFNARLLLSRNPAPRENLVITRSTSRTSNDSIEAYCTKMEQKLQEEITGELQKDGLQHLERRDHVGPVNCPSRLSRGRQPSKLSHGGVMFSGKGSGGRGLPISVQGRDILLAVASADSLGPREHPA